MNTVPVTIQDHIIGNKDAKIELIEYGDFQCPYCAKAYYIVKEIQKKMGEDIRFIFRNYPLEDLHPHALHAAIAAETAGLKGKFWEMHDILFENYRHLDDPSLILYAGKIGLNPREFEREFGNDQTIDKVEEDINSGNRHGVEGTPSFFINGKFYKGDWTGREFPEYLESLVHDR